MREETSVYFEKKEPTGHRKGRSCRFDSESEEASIYIVLSEGRRYSVYFERKEDTVLTLSGKKLYLYLKRVEAVVSTFIGKKGRQCSLFIL